MKTVVLELATREQLFPGDAVDAPFTYSLRRTDLSTTGVAQSDIQMKTNATSATFPNVPAGKYTAVAAKLGVEATADFEVDESDDGTGQKFQVPETLKVTVGAGGGLQPTQIPAGRRPRT